MNEIMRFLMFLVDQKKLINVLGLCIATSLLATACDSSSSSVSSEQPTVVVPKAASTLALRVLNDQGEPAGAGINVKVTDVDGGSILSSGTSGVTATTDAGGNIFVDLPSNVTSGQLNLTVSQDGYFGVTKTIDLAGSATETSLTVTKKVAAQVTDTVQDANGNEVTKTVITKSVDVPLETKATIDLGDSSGTEPTVAGTIAEVKQDTSNNTQKVVTQVVIPNTVTATTASGQPAQGALVVDAAVYDNDAPRSLEALPGGLDVAGGVSNPDAVPAFSDSSEPTDNETDASDRGGFISAGFVALEVRDSTGAQITNFSQGNATGLDVDKDGDTSNDKGLIITTLIPKTTTHPDTDQPLGIDDKIPMWSFDAATGEWKREGTAIIFEDAGDGTNWRARFTAEHLTYWNLDYWGRYCRNNSTGGGALLELFDNQTKQRILRPLQLRFTRKGNGYSATNVIADGYLRGYLPRRRLLLEVTDLTTGQVLPIASINNGSNSYDSNRGFNWCRNSRSNDLYLDTQAITNIAVTDIQFKVQTSCSNASLNAENGLPAVIPSTQISLYKTTGNSIDNYIAGGATDVQGLLNFTNLRQDGTFRIYAWDRINSTSIVRNFTPTSLGNPEIIDIKQTCPDLPTTTGTTGSNGNT